MRHVLRHHVGKVTHHIIYPSYLSVYSVSHKTLISRLGSCRDFEAALRRTFEPSLNIGIVGCHWSPFCVEKSWNVFLKNLNFFSTEERKTWISWMTSGWVNHRQTFFWKWTNPLNESVIRSTKSGIKPSPVMNCNKSKHKSQLYLSLLMLNKRTMNKNTMFVWQYRLLCCCHNVLWNYWDYY